MNSAKIATALILSGLLGAACAPAEEPEPTAEDGAVYFGFGDGVTLVYERSDGQEEEHTYTLQTDADTRTYQVVARAGGFVMGPRSGTLEVTATDLFQNRFNDCVTTCGVANPAVHLFSWPVKERSRKETTTTIQWSENGVDGDAVDETHAFQVGETVEISVPAGDFNGFEVNWTATQDGNSMSARWVVVPGVGVVHHETFDGLTLELKETP
jgi:hypothetical protein